MALTQFERMLVDKGVNIDQSLRETIASTPWWKPFEDHKLKRIKRSFDTLADATYAASDDIAALVRCRDRTAEMGGAIVESSVAKHELSARLLEAKSTKEAIEILRNELKRHKVLLSQ